MTPKDKKFLNYLKRDVLEMAYSQSPQEGKSKVCIMILGLETDSLEFIDVPYSSDPQMFSDYAELMIEGWIIENGIDEPVSWVSVTPEIIDLQGARFRATADQSSLEMDVRLGNISNSSVSIGEGANASIQTTQTTITDTGGGAYIGERVNTEGGDFTGRDSVHTRQTQSTSIRRWGKNRRG